MVVLPLPPHSYPQPHSVAGNKTVVQKDHISRALDVLSQVLKAATAAAAAFPPAQEFVGGIGSIVDMAKATHQNETDRKAVKKNLEEARKRLDLCKGTEKLSDEISERLLKLESDLKADVGSIDDAMNESWWRRWTEGDAQEMGKYYGQLSSTLSLFITETVISMDGRIDTLSNMAKELKCITRDNYEAISQLRADEKFKQLNQVKNVEYDAGPFGLRKPCTDKTREQILDELMTWATDDSSTQVYWLSGMAGTGKTTIAYSLCELLRNSGLLCTSFFCSRAVITSTTPRDVLPLIAFHLASYSQSFAQSLLNALREHDNANIEQKELDKQFHTLIARPAKETSLMSNMRKRCIVVFDGADEASNVQEAGKLIALFLKNAEKLPFKIFISSRRDGFIKSEFEAKTLRFILPFCFTTWRKALWKLTSDCICIRERLRRVTDVVSEADINTLAEHSGMLFVYAAVLCSFIDQGTKAEVKARLQAVLDSSPKPIPGTKKRPYDSLDQIYTSILAAAEEDSPDIWIVLLVIFTAQNPLTVSGIAGVLNLHEFQVSKVITSLHAVLAGSDSDRHPVTIFHTSFRDYLTDKSRGGDFCQLMLAPHKELVVRCLEIMEVGLKMDNICMVESKDVPRLDIETSKIRNCISEALEYSCTSWIYHLVALSEGELVLYEDDVLHFFATHTLRWIECMAWLGKLGDTVRSLRRIELDQKSSSDLRFATMDTRRCVLQCFEAIRDFPLEVYHSALVWLPQNSRILVPQEVRQQNWKVTRGILQAWDACESTLVGHSNSVTSIWNADVGKEEWKLEGHSEGHSNVVLSVAIYRDGRKVVSGSLDNTVRIWDADSGKEEWKMEGHAKSAWSVTISRDGRRVTSGSDDHSVRVWNSDTGKEEWRVKGHSGIVRAVAMSHDGRRVISGSSDFTVRLWNADTGEEERKFEGHSGTLWSVGISHDGRRIISGSEDNTMRIWNTHTGEEEMKFDGLPRYPDSVAFSGDGKKVASKFSYPDTVWIWTVETGEVEVMAYSSFNSHPEFRSSSSCSITYESAWLSCTRHSTRLWLPSFRQSFRSTASAGQTICFGHENGDLIVV
ncbi:hypothetical protein CPB84DRAFT_1845005 [Gymnopilus junonius]|uniref:Nephrocystin 3-like N-terminal domain-containing protein n=1 Tax=Gymnopilus junonius TaxID=109634 RepID=A0A9P5NVB6_GYMJU|nr:hypothetical protein CPB84DRAFT_1845005 [Gymnopilus junonius]